MTSSILFLVKARLILFFCSFLHKINNFCCDYYSVCFHGDMLFVTMVIVYFKPALHARPRINPHH